MDAGSPEGNKARGDRIAVLGGSKGGELSLLAAATFPDLVGPVVAYTPSSVVWAGIDFSQPRASTRSSWSLAGEPLPCVPYPAGVGPSSSERGLSVLPIYDRGLENAAAVAQAAIRIERATGPVLVISGGDDRMWPAERMCVMVVDRARRAGRETLVRHLNFPEAGHVLTPYQAPASSAAMPMPFDLGGSPSECEKCPRGRVARSRPPSSTARRYRCRLTSAAARGGRRDHQAAASDAPTWADSDSGMTHAAPRFWMHSAMPTRVVNVGAGAGAYEPVGRFLIAVEPSRHMIRQRSSKASLVVQASAEALPFRAEAFDAALAVLTLHHWTDWRCGLDEMKRVANRLVVLTIEPTELGNFWLTEVYFPEIVALDRGRCPSTAEIEHHLGDCRVDRIAIPHDCSDGFLGAFWRRPEAYLDPKVRAGMSGFTLLDPNIVARGVAQLESDLETGAWERRFGHIRSLDALDVCYRLVVTD